MKQRSREINIFSMSALDLFASALGAFILMSLIFMIFFTMTSQGASQAEETQAALAQAEAALAQAKAAKSAADERIGSLERELDKVRIPHLDIVICLDVTGSMRNQIEGLKQGIVELARVLDRLAPSTGIGVVAFGDRFWHRVLHDHPIVETTSMGSLESFVDTLEAGMNDPGRNDDRPEAVDTALAKAVAMDWRAESERRYIIVITDNPAYPEKIQSSYDRARNFAASGKQHVSTVMVGSEAEDFLRTLAEVGQGRFVAGRQSMVSSILLSILGV